MNQFAIDRPPEHVDPDCTELMKLADKELASFFHAVTKLFGSEQAELSAQDWLHELAANDRLPSSAREWRRITIKVSTQLASRMQARSKALQPI